MVLLFPAGIAPLGNLGKSINSSADTKELCLGRQPLDTAGRQELPPTRLPARPPARLREELGRDPGGRAGRSGSPESPGSLQECAG